MRLTRLEVAALPGLERPFALEPGPGVNVVVGPNTSGKTSLVRAVHSLLWPEAVAGAERLRLAATLAVGDRTLVARRGLDGAAGWEQDGQAVAAPTLPSGHLRDRYELGLLDLAERGRGDEAFAAEVRRQMTGGFDLDLIGAALFPRGAGQTTRLHNALVKAEADLRELERRLQHLREREKDLARLQAERDEAAAAGRQVQAVREAQAALTAAAELARAESALAAFPAGQAAFREDDADTLRALTAGLRLADDEIAAGQARLAAAATELATLPAAPPGAPDPAAIEPLLADWAEAARVHDQAVATHEGARARLAQLAGQLAGAPVPAATAAAPGREAVARLGRLFVEAETARARRQAAELLLLDPTLAGTGDETSEAALRSALAALDRWLAAPETAPLGPALTAAAGLVAVVLLARPPANLAALVAAAVATVGALALTVSAFGMARAATRRAAAARAALAAAGFAEPVPDREAGVALRDRVRQALGRRETAATWLEQLRAAGRQAAGEEETARAAGAVLLESCGLGRELDAAGLLHDAPLVAAALDAQAEVARWAAVVQTGAETVAARAERARVDLRRIGLADAECDEPAAAAGALKAWREGQSRRAQALAESEREREAVAAARQRRQSAADELARLRARLDLPADGARDDELRRLAERAGDWQRAAMARDEARAALATRRDAVAPELAAADAAALDALLAKAQARGEREPQLRQECADLAAELKQAREGHAYEEALATCERRRDELAADRDLARRAALADAALADLRGRTAASRPAVLERAAGHLGDFTRGAHRLELVGGGGATPAFAATDTRTNARQSLDELSDGTRAQLLLAVRLAFIETMEDGEPLPLFLDEALTTTDDERFAAVAVALARLARDQGRQVFYLTSQPGDAAAWQRALAGRELPPPRVLDLAAARGLAAAARPDQLPPPAATAAPVLPVPPLAPRRGRDGQHVAWLLLDDALVARLTAARAALVGTALTVRDDLVAGGVLDEGIAEALRERADLLGLFCEYRQLGRGRPVTVEDLADSEAVSGTMRPRVLELLAATGGDPRAFDAGLDDVKGLRGNVAARLREYLLEQGVLPDRDPLDEPALLHRLLGELGRRADLAGRPKADAALVADCVARWWRAAEAALAAPSGTPE